MINRVIYTVKPLFLGGFTVSDMRFRLAIDHINKALNLKCKPNQIQTKVYLYAIFLQSLLFLYELECLDCVVNVLFIVYISFDTFINVLHVCTVHHFHKTNRSSYKNSSRSLFLLLLNYNKYWWINDSGLTIKFHQNPLKCNRLG